MDLVPAAARSKRKPKRIPKQALPTTPLARLLTRSDSTTRITALDAFELAKQKWLIGERIDIGKLADELGVARATVFRWVGTREQLYSEVISAAFAQSIEWARRASTGTGADLLTDVTRNLLTALVASQPLRTFIKQDTEFALRIVMSSASPVEGRVIAAVRELIEGEAAAGYMQPKIDVDSLAYVIVRIAESFLYRDVLTGDPPDVETATKAIGMVFAAQAAPKRKR
ncbi:MAG: TetR/AcrR family transcriptional regulator [Deltaproteobacteria bacterium]|nr:TetR/AcrR family transcriptional regulator [Deltaproteobacteria bacterium]